jgi:hypothetical protein
LALWAHPRLLLLAAWHAVVRETTAKRKTDLCNPSEKLRETPIENLPVVWNIRASGNDEWPFVGDSYSPSSGYGAISCFKRPGAGQVMKRELLSFPAGKHDDQVDALGLIGQLLDQMVPGQRPKPPVPPKRDTGYRPIGLGERPLDWLMF